MRGNIGEACAAIGLSRVYIYRMKRTKPRFSKRWDAALEAAYDRLEAEAWRRGHDGVVKKVRHMGAVVGNEREYSDSLLLKLLAANRRKFRNQSQVEMVGNPNAPLLDPTQLELRKDMTSEEAMKLYLEAVTT
jgi:hypothetical protein